MEALEAARVRMVLDRMAREKEIAHAYFTRVGDALEDVERRRWFRRMAQDEKDQRKILLKHRKELCRGVNPDDEIVVSPVHAAVADLAKDIELSYVDALRLAVRTAEEARRFCDVASDIVADRSCRIFLKILAEESRAHRDELLGELREVERIDTSTSTDAEAA